MYREINHARVMDALRLNDVLYPKAAILAREHVTKLHQWTAHHAGWQVVQGSALYLVPPGVRWPTHGLRVQQILELTGRYIRHIYTQKCKHDSVSHVIQHTSDVHKSN